MSARQSCEECGAELPANAPQGLCPRCLVGMGLQLTPARTPTASTTERLGDRIGRYKLLEQLGEGGCGTVYLAEQEEPVRRQVALKVIKLGMQTRQVIARFEAERQALAVMDHPHIAKVHDAGATETGRPYFVMELVRGTHITHFCDQHRLSTNEGLDLFIQVCQAVQHAHQKGIIHRDLKPSNVLVTRHTPGEPGTPKVIDFGIAKATQQPLSEQPLTELQPFLGTPAYMSPEQAGGTDVDTRSDIYALGVLLYELLSGRLPFDPEQLRQAGVEGICRKIREEEPPRPSTRLSTLSPADQSSVARRRQTEPAALTTLIRGDLDWIVMKTLEKERARRYESAASLAQDKETLREALALSRKLRHGADPGSPSVLYSLALVLKERGKLDEAESLFREALAQRRQLLPEDHPDVALTLNTLGNLLRERGRLDEAESYLREALAMQRDLSRSVGAAPETAGSGASHHRGGIKQPRLCAAPARPAHGSGSSAPPVPESGAESLGTNSS